MNFSYITLITILLFTHYVISKDNDGEPKQNSLDYGGPTNKRFKCGNFERLKKCGCSCSEKCENRLNPGACPRNEKPKKACYCLRGFFRNSMGKCVPADQCDGGFTDAPDHLLNDAKPGPILKDGVEPTSYNRAVKRDIDSLNEPEHSSDGFDDLNNPNEGRVMVIDGPNRPKRNRVNRLSETGQSADTNQGGREPDDFEHSNRPKKNRANRLSETGESAETGQGGREPDDFDSSNRLKKNRVNRLSETGESAETGQGGRREEGTEAPSKTNFEELANDDSPESEDCGPNERATKCGNKCQESLEYIQNKKTCTNVCEIGCFCRTGYFRDGFNNCNQAEDKYLEGIIGGQTRKVGDRLCVRENEEYNDCGDRCIESLSNLYNHTLCEPYQCLRGCYCNPDFLRNAEGVCVSAKRPKKVTKDDEDDEEEDEEDDDEEDDDSEDNNQTSRNGREGKGRDRERPDERHRERHEDFERRRDEDFDRGGPEDFERGGPEDFERGRPEDFDRGGPEDFVRGDEDMDGEMDRERSFPMDRPQRFRPHESERGPPQRSPNSFRRRDNIPNPPFRERRTPLRHHSDKQPSDCSPKEIHSECGNRCMESTDNYYNPGNCNPNDCDSGCFCRPEYFRSRTGICTIPNKKKPKNECPPNEAFTKCGNRCMESLANKLSGRTDNSYCDPNHCDIGCFCVPVLFRDRGGRCVELHHHNGRHSRRY